MDTRKKILLSALKLFNRKGLSQVTLRSIAKEIGISQGNLNYHFKKREDIIEALYFELVEKMSAEIAKLSKAGGMMEYLFRSSHKSLRIFHGYRFLLLDLVDIMRYQPKIREHYRKLQEQRKSEFLLIFGQMQENGVMRPEEYDGEYDNLYKRMNILGDFWIANAEVLGGTKNKDDLIKRYNLVLLESIYPYLTAKGKENFFKARQHFLES